MGLLTEGASKLLYLIIDPILGLLAFPVQGNQPQEKPGRSMTSCEEISHNQWLATYDNGETTRIFRQTT